jgi:tetratricopeptide (TPR) repeat protein
MESTDDIIEEKVSRGLRILRGKEPYDHAKYRSGLAAAEGEFKDALALNPNSYRALLALGVCYSYRPTKHRDAIEALKQAIDIRPEASEGYYELGVTLFHVGERGSFGDRQPPYEEAVRCFEKALELGHAPKGGIYNLVGTTHFRLGRYDDAIAWFEKSAESLSEEGGWQPSTFFLAAEANELLGRTAEAIRWYELYKKRGLGTDHDEIDMRIRNLRVLDENRTKAL